MPPRNAMEAMAASMQGAAEEEYREDLNNIVMCPDCKETPPNLVEEFSDGDLVCASCGRVLGERIIDTRSEWRTFANDDHGGEDPNRVGKAADPLSDQPQLETSIAFGEGGARARDLRRAQAKVDRTQGSSNIAAASAAIKDFCSQMDTSNKVYDCARHIYQITETENKALTRGKNHPAILAGCIFAASRICGEPRTFRDVQAHTDVSKKDLGRLYKSLQVIISRQRKHDTTTGLGFGDSLAGAPKSVSSSAEDLCIRFCGTLFGVRSTKVSNFAIAVVGNASSITDFSGRSPLSIAATCIYFASSYLGLDKTVKEIAAASGVSDGTVRNAYKLIWGERARIVPEKYAKDGSLDRLPAP